MLYISRSYARVAHGRAQRKRQMRCKLVPFSSLQNWKKRFPYIFQKKKKVMTFFLMERPPYVCKKKKVKTRRKKKKNRFEYQSLEKKKTVTVASRIATLQKQLTTYVKKRESVKKKNTSNVRRPCECVCVCVCICSTYRRNKKEVKG